MGRPLLVSEVGAGHSVLAGTLRFRAQFSSAPSTGHLSDSWVIPFEDSLPIRRAAAYKGQHNFAGLWWCATNRRHVGFESWCERDHLMCLDFDPDVTGVASQPFSITLPGSLSQITHVPDYFVRRADGTGVVIDVRPDALVKPEDKEVFDATAALCTSVGWGYQRLGGLPSVYVANLHWLAGYRHPRCIRGGLPPALLAHLGAAGPLSLRDLAAAVGDPVWVLPTLFHLMWQQQITANLRTTPLHLDTMVSLVRAA
ncbi:TnsA-like heteromeric transposase endonuclease subunit [Pseudarthrobacter sp. S9]|uniref:TnsA-like heteromeric transposase endonuclease subunit n=1 Tax=Pseudarthrobacter sp. S9 TaxID=3418421 RepID=UPI003D06BC46